MKICTFYRQSHCERIVDFERLITEYERKDVLRKAVSMLCNFITVNAPYEDIRKQIQEFLRAEYATLDMSQFAWQRETYVENDTFLFERLLLYFGSDFSFENSFVSTHMDVSFVFPDGSSCLDGKVHLILKDANEAFHGFIIHTGYCERSMNGKSIHTSAATDLHCMVAKYCLEEKYPGITIHSVYLSHKTDTSKDMVRQLEVSTKATSNIHSLSYSDHYTNGVFDRDFFQELIMNVIENSLEVNCFKCKWKRLCKTPHLGINTSTSISVKNAEYVMPEYTDEQMKIVCHKDGPMLVCAGPGSGKTAALIGRIKYLVEECKIDPSFILVVTFTNKAADELRRRCLSFLSEDNLPQIATLHSFCYGILKNNEDLLESGLTILTPGENLRLIQNIVSVMPPLTGLQGDTEPNKIGLYASLAQYLEQFFSMTEFEFFQENPTLGKDFISFAHQYKEILECRGFISFDEQITFCNRLFEAHPEVLQIYQNIYKYIMVDEYQDVDEEQVKLLDSLAPHENILVVGDDDQNIYSFRGASSNYMKQFPDKYKETAIVVLNDNFRSTKSLVDAAKALIKNNSKRISKNIKSSRQTEGILPIVIPQMDTAKIDDIIKNLIENGYQYDDIAILSSKNAPLEELHGSLKAPTVLAKSYLREDGLFLFAYCVLKILYEPEVSDKVFLQYLKLFGKEKYIVKEKGISLYEATLNAYGYEDIRTSDTFLPQEGTCLYEELMHLIDMQELLRNTACISVFLDICKYRIQWEYSDSYDILLELLDYQGIKSISDMMSLMDYLITFEDDKRVDANTRGKVTLITCHDAKGKEYPVVIIRNDFVSFDEESRRLFYVALTRAEKLAYILCDKECNTEFLNEIPHTMED